MAVPYKPAGYHDVTPYLTVADVRRSIEFLTTAMDGEVIEAMEDGSGTIRHAELRLGDSIVMLGQAREEEGAVPAMCYLYVEDCDAIYQRALAAGATSLMEPSDQFYGDRNAGIADPSGCRWWLATHVEDVSPEEMQRRMRDMG